MSRCGSVPRILIYEALCAVAPFYSRTSVEGALGRLARAEHHAIPQWWWLMRYGAVVCFHPGVTAASLRTTLTRRGDLAGAEQSYLASLDWARQQQAKS